MTQAIWTGKPDLNNCDREPIHIPGRIQSHGVLLAFDPQTLNVTHFSANAPDFCAIPTGALPGASIKAVLGAPLALQIEKSLIGRAEAPVVPARLFGVRLKGRTKKLNATAHIYAGKLIVELEPAKDGNFTAPLDLVRSMLTKLQASRTLHELCDETVNQLRELIGYDRVMIYRFLDDGTGQVIAEAKRSDQESLLNLRYPASDIPQQARELYKRNWVRLISDVASPTIEITASDPRRDAILDLTHADLRSVSPIHIEYLNNMGVGASMSISIIAGGELWGLIACHHKQARIVPANVRSAAELLGQVFSLQIQTVEGIEAYVTMRAARALLDRVVSEFPIEGNLVDNLTSRLEQLSSFIKCDGVGIYFDGVWRTTGATPNPEEIKALANHIDLHSDGKIFADHNLTSAYAPAGSWRSGVRGVLALPLSYEGRNWLLFFRKEAAYSIDWGGDPNKPVTANAAGRISPRKSFEAWKEEVRGQSLPWSSRERLIADTLRVYLLDIIVRFSEVIMEERRQAQQRQRLLTSELNHRVKGTLELIQSLIHHGYEDEGKIQKFVRLLEGRIRAIALAHDAISVNSGSEVRNLMEAAIAMQAVPHGVVDLQGPDVKLDPKAYTVLALVIHEMTANASRSGAFSTAAGHLSINWFLDASGKLIVLWEEYGKSDARRQIADELSNIIIRRNIPHALAGEADISPTENGLKAAFVIPHRFIVKPPALEVTQVQRPAIGSFPRPLEGYSILIVEDQMAAAIDLEQSLRSRGAAEVHISGNTASTLELLDSVSPDVAILDVDLGDTTSMGLADELVRLGIPFVFSASDIDLKSITAGHKDVPVVSKPYSIEAISAALKDAVLPNLIRAVLTKLV